MAQSKLLASLREKEYYKAEEMWKLVDDPDDYFDGLDEDVVKRIGSNSYLVTKEALLEVAPEYARENGLEMQEVHSMISSGDVSSVLEFFSAYRGDVMVQTSFGEAGTVAVGVE